MDRSDLSWIIPYPPLPPHVIVISLSFVVIVNVFGYISDVTIGKCPRPSVYKVKIPSEYT